MPNKGALPRARVVVCQSMCIGHPYNDFMIGAGNPMVRRFTGESRNDGLALKSPLFGLPI